MLANFYDVVRICWSLREEEKEEKLCTALQSCTEYNNKFYDHFVLNSPPRVVADLFFFMVVVVVCPSAVRRVCVFQIKRRKRRRMLTLDAIIFLCLNYYSGCVTVFFPLSFQLVRVLWPLLYTHTHTHTALRESRLSSWLEGVSLSESDAPQVKKWFDPERRSRRSRKRATTRFYAALVANLPVFFFPLLPFRLESFSC